MESDNRSKLKYTESTQGEELTPQARFGKYLQALVDLEYEFAIASQARTGENYELGKSEERASKLLSTLTELEIAGLELGRPLDETNNIVFVHARLLSYYTLGDSPVGIVAHAATKRAEYIRNFLHPTTPEDQVVNYRNFLDANMETVLRAAYEDATYLERTTIASLCNDFQHIQRAVIVLGIGTPSFYQQLVTAGDAIIRRSNAVGAIEGNTRPLKDYLDSLRKLAYSKASRPEY